VAVETRAAALAEFPVPRRIEVLPLALLRRAAYQRDQDDLWVRRIVSLFDARLVRRPWVSLREGTYWLVDGQHTVSALADLGIDSIECEVLEGLSYQDEARLHDSIQRLRKAPRVFDSYRALLEAGDPEVIGLNEAVGRQGYRVVKKGGGAGSAISAIGALWQAWRVTPPKDVEAALDAMRPWKAIERSIPGYILAGMCLFVRDVDSYDSKRLKAVVSTNSPTQIELKVKDFGPQGASSGTRPVRARDAILSLYNRGLAGSERAKFKDK